MLYSPGVFHSKRAQHLTALPDPAALDFPCQVHVQTSLPLVCCCFLKVEDSVA